jgi:hypothetical protein
VFHRSRNRIGSGTETLLAAVRQLRQHLPESWSVSENPRTSEATIVMRSPDSKVAHLLVVAKRKIEPKDLAGILPSANVHRARVATLLVTAPFLSPRTRELLAAAGASYLDSTGNLRLSLDRPAVFVEQQGAQKDPAREPRPLVSLKGRAAGRVVRALCDFGPPYGVRALAERCGTAPASVSRVVSLLEREAILGRGERGEITEVDWPALLRRWTQDYQFASSNRTIAFLDPKGLDAFVENVRRLGRRYALSGSLAAARKAPGVSPGVAIAYVEDPIATADALDLRLADRGANVFLAAPFDPVVFDRTWSHGGVTYAALSQVAADLLTSPGPARAEGAELAAWMRKNERGWRT